jgi:hypothetical protein
LAAPQWQAAIRCQGFGLSDLVIAYHQTGRSDEMAAAAKQLLAARPEFTIASWLKTQFRQDKSRLEEDIAALKAAGLPLGQQQNLEQEKGPR